MAAPFPERLRSSGLPESGGWPSFGVRCVGKILMTANVIAAARPTIPTM